MRKIGIISDTHGFIDDRLYPFLESVEEIWHAGDIGNLETLETLEKWKPTKAVSGNIDDHIIRSATLESMIIKVEGVKILMRHIAGYPNRYNATTRRLIEIHRPKIVVCGHSHILKVMYDKKLDHLHINPGSIGNKGFHNLQTAIRLDIDGTIPKNLEILELKRWKRV